MGLTIAPIIALWRVTLRRRQQRQRYLTTKRLIEALPDDLRKDLDWPDLYWEQHDSNFGRGN